MSWKVALFVIAIVAIGSLVAVWASNNVPAVTKLIAPKAPAAA